MVYRFFRQRRNLHLAAWLFLMVAGVSVFGIYYPIGIVVAHTVSNVLLAAALFYGSAWVANRFFEKSKWAQGLVIEVAFFAVICLLRVAINYQLSQSLIQDRNGDMLFSPLGRVMAFVFITSLLVAALGFSYQLIQNRFQRERAAKNLLQEQQAAQFQLLKSQINPHFLFNALNNVYSLVELRSPEAPKMLLKLSDLLRYVIYESQKSEVGLHREVSYIHTFIELFQMRNEETANIRFEVVGEMNDIAIEPMILIPLVENCFKHADFGINPDAWAVFRLEYAPERLTFSTQNTFQPTDHQKDGVGGVGLVNIGRRLRLRYPDNHHFRSVAEGGVFYVEITIYPPIA